MERREVANNGSVVKRSTGKCITRNTTNQSVHNDMQIYRTTNRVACYVFMVRYIYISIYPLVGLFLKMNHQYMVKNYLISNKTEKLIMVGDKMQCWKT
jgi:hypothetical protein